MIGLGSAFANICNPNSCDITLRNDNMIDLKDNSLYGEMLQRIVLSNCCADDKDGGEDVTPRLEIIVLTPPPSGPGPHPIYSPYRLDPNNAVLFKNLNGSREFLTNPAFSSLVFKSEWRDATCPHGKNGACSVKLCITMPTPLGNMPLKCKTYNNVINPDNTIFKGGGIQVTKSQHNSNISATRAISDLQEPVPVCDILAAACRGNSDRISQSMFTFTGKSIQCMTDTLKQNFFEAQPGCILQNNNDANVDMSFLASFAAFQEALKVTVRALLILYTIGFGMKMILNQSEFSLESAVMFIIKMILVGYFAVGWGPAYFQDGIKKTENGATKWTLPILTQLTSDLASITFSAATGERGLCEFDNSRYPKGYGYYGLWDRIDCKLGAYIFVKKIFGVGITGKSQFGDNWREIPAPNLPDTSPRPESDSKNKSQASTAEQIAMFPILFLMFLGGNWVFFLTMVYFMTIVLSLILGFISMYTVCLVTLHVLVYLSPIFVPLALFERTKSYFDSWVKITLSCALQPMVIACFIAMMLTMFDKVMYGTCEFQRRDYTNGEEYRSTFEIRVPRENVGECTMSVGYVIISYVFGLGQESYGAILFTVNVAKDVLNIWMSCIILAIFTYIVRFFMDGLYNFAADITGGLDVSGVTFDMGKLADSMKGGVDKLKDQMGSKMKGAKGGGKEGGKGGEGKEGGDKGGKGGGDTAKAPSMGGGGGGGSDGPSMSGGK